MKTSDSPLKYGQNAARKLSACVVLRVTQMPTNQPKSPPIHIHICTYKYVRTLMS